MVKRYNSRNRLPEQEELAGIDEKQLLPEREELDVVEDNIITEVKPKPKKRRQSREQETGGTLNLGTKVSKSQILKPSSPAVTLALNQLTANPELLQAYIHEIQDELNVRQGLVESRKQLEAPKPLDNEAWVKRSHADVQRWRFREMATLQQNPELAVERYVNDPLSFICHWCDVYEPRNAGKGEDKPHRMPFILFKRQEELLMFYHACVVEEGPGIVEKSRDMGATWCGVAYSVWMWLFHEGSTIGWGSAKSDKLDRIGDPGTIFEKIRLLIRGLPKIFLPKHFTEDDMMQQRIINPSNGNVITGEVGDNIGRGGRSRLYFVDEAAHLQHPEEAEAALSENTRVRIDISSVSGPGTVFHRTRESGVEWAPGKPIYKHRHNVFIMDWSDHPEKTAEWAKQRKESFEARGLAHVYAREIDRNYAATLEGSIIQPEWIEAAIDADKKLRLIMDVGPVTAGLDIGDAAPGDANALTVLKHRVFKKICQWKMRDTALTARNAIRELTPFTQELASLGQTHLYLNYDCIGIGSGVKAEWNRLRDDNLLPAEIVIVPWNAGASVLNPHERIIPNDDQTPFNREFFANLKAQGWWNLRQAFYNTWLAVTQGVTMEVEKLICIDSKACDKTLLHKFRDELSQATTAPPTSSMRTAVNKAPRGSTSPNMADSAVIASWPVPSEAPGLIGSFFAPSVVG